MELKELIQTVISNIRNKEWWSCAITRAIKTMVQTAVSLLAVENFYLDVDWSSMPLVIVGAGLASIATSLIGIPEVSDEESDDEGTEEVYDEEIEEDEESVG